MSLEQALAENTAALKHLAAVISSGATFAPASAESATNKDALGLVDGDPSGTRYFVIEKHNTVYAQKPGDADPGFDGAKIVSAAEFLTKKAEYEALGKSVLAAEKAKSEKGKPAKAEPSTKPAASPAPATPAASTASSTTQGPSDAEVTAKLTELAKIKTEADPELGRKAARAVLDEVSGKPGAKAPEILAMKINQKVLDALQAKITELTTPAGNADDDLGI